jgi:hypothetical protein
VRPRLLPSDTRALPLRLVVFREAELDSQESSDCQRGRMASTVRLDNLLGGMGLRGCNNATSVQESLTDA